MKMPRTLYWVVETENGQQIRGKKQNAVCSLSHYSSILWRKHRTPGNAVKRLAVSLTPDVML